MRASADLKHGSVKAPLLDGFRSRTRENFPLEKFSSRKIISRTKRHPFPLRQVHPTLYTCVMSNENDAPIVIPDPKNSPMDGKKSAWKEIAKEVVIFAIIAFGIVLPFRLFIAEPYLVDGRSMDPTFATGDYLIVDKLSYELGTPKRNTVVVFKYPNDTSKTFIKRIIGLPGETVEENGNTITITDSINKVGFNIDQSYVVHEAPGKFKVTLGPDEYFVMGDNRAESFDSRSWGPLQKKYILGKPVLRLWPLKELGVLPGNDAK